MAKRWGAWAMSAALLLAAGVAQAEPRHLGEYSPSAFSAASMGGDQAVLVHAVAKYCPACDRQRSSLNEAFGFVPGVARHMVILDASMERWGMHPLFTDNEVARPGELLLFRGDELLARSREDNLDAMVALLTTVIEQPGWGPIEVPPLPVSAP